MRELAGREESGSLLPTPGMSAKVEVCKQDLTVDDKIGRSLSRHGQPATMSAKKTDMHLMYASSNSESGIVSGSSMVLFAYMHPGHAGEYAGPPERPSKKARRRAPRLVEVLPVGTFVVHLSRILCGTFRKFQDCEEFKKFDILQFCP